MIPVLALIVAILAVFVSPFITWALARQQIAVTSREAWLREFRERVATLLSGYGAFLDHVEHHTGDPEKEQRLADIKNRLRPPNHTIELLIAERGPQRAEFIRAMDALMNAPLDKVALSRREFTDAARDIVRVERAEIATDPGVWRALLASLGFRVTR